MLQLLFQSRRAIHPLKKKQPHFTVYVTAVLNFKQNNYFRTERRHEIA